MFSFDTDTKEIARLLGISPDPIAPSDGDILKPFGANQLPIPGAADAIALPTLVSVACDNLVFVLVIYPLATSFYFCSWQVILVLHSPQL